MKFVGCQPRPLQIIKNKKKETKRSANEIATDIRVKTFIEQISYCLKVEVEIGYVGRKNNSIHNEDKGTPGSRK